MSLNDITLPSVLLADLYKNVLVQGTARPVPDKVPVPYLGKNGKNIMLLVNNAGVPYLPDNELAFLTSVLSACGLDLSQVAIVNWHSCKEKDAAGLREQLRPQHALLLNVDATEAGFVPAEPYTVQTDGQLQYVTAPALSAIESSKEAKKQLWLALKQLFGI